MKYYIADTHFGHKNVLRFDNRPFTDVDEMDRVLIENWNSVVRDEDDVYIIGDLIYRTDKEPTWYLEQLKGKKHLIVGNHDEKLIKDKSFRSYFVEIRDMLAVFDDDKKLFLCHYPMAEWPSYFRGSYHLYAHIHNNINETFDIMKGKDRALNVGCMINGYKPVTFKELVINNEKFKGSFN